MTEQDQTRTRKHAKNIAWAAFTAVCMLTFCVVVLAVTGSAGDLREFNSLLVTVTGGFIALIGASVGLQGWYK
jgi:hypothetical protein